MKIVKLTTGLIELRTNSGIVFESFTSCITTARVICMGATVQIFVEGRYINIEASEVTSTQVLPAAEVPLPALITASDLLALLNADFFEVCGGSGYVSPYFVEEIYQTVSGGILVNTVVYEYDIQDGETVGLKAENIARRGTSATGAYGEWCVHAQRIGGVTTLSPTVRSFNSSSYGVGIGFVVSGTKIQVIATVFGAIAIHHKGIIRAFKM